MAQYVLWRFHANAIEMWPLLINLIFILAPDIPGVDCKTEGDPNYPDYVNCKEFSDSQKVENYRNVSWDLIYAKYVGIPRTQ